MKKLIEKTESLRIAYNQDVLIKVAREYARTLRFDGLEVNLWFDAIDELIIELENDRTTIDSILAESANIMSEYSRLLEDLKGSTEQTRRFSLESLITAPVFLLQVVYIYNHEKFEGSENLWDFAEDHNGLFTKILEDK